MRWRSLLVLSSFVGLSPSVSAPLQADTPYPNIAPTEAKTPAEELKTFKVPAGFEVQLVASEPDIRKPIQMAFDAKGRLWVTTSEEYPFPAVGRPGKDRLYVLEDFGPDGKAKKVSIFADDLNIPIGVLPLPDCKSAIVSSIEPAPNKQTPATCWIWKLTDTDGDGKYDKKEKLYGPFGCRDTHGMNNSYTLMPDGWVYACHGYLNDSRPKGSDGKEIFMNSGNTFRFRLDGSHIEIWTHGQVNPFGIAVDPYFNLYTADCHSKPITQLIHGATYQSFSKPHDGLGFAPHVTIHGHDSTALCGLVYYSADHYPKEYSDCMFLGNVTSNCINWDKIDFVGSTPKATDKGMFLASSDLWCRPTDVKLGPDGALYWADFYNKIIGHYEVGLDHPGRDKLRGRVWRIVWKGKDGKGEVPKIAMDMTKKTTSQLMEEGDNPNLAVRLLALNELLNGPHRMSKTPGITTVGQYVFEIWLNKQVEILKLSNATDLKGFSEPQQLMASIHYVKALSKYEQQSDFSTQFIKGLLLANSAKPATRRVAVEAVISHPSPSFVQSVADAIYKVNRADDHLIMAMRVALRESLYSLDNWNEAAGKTGFTKGELTTLASIALAIPKKGASHFLIEHLRDLTESPSLPEYVEHAARYVPEEKDLTTIFTFIRDLDPDNLKRALLLFQAYLQGIQKRGGSIKNDAVAQAQAEKLTMKAFDFPDPQVIQAGVDLANSLKMTSAFDPMLKLAENKSRNEGQRAAALPGLLSIDTAKALPALVKILADSTEPIGLREKAAQVLAGSNQALARDELVKALQAAPARLQTVIAFAMAGNQAAASQFLKAVEEGKASARLLQDKALQTRLNESRAPKAGERIAALTKGLPSADKKLTQLMKLRSDGFGKAKSDSVSGKQIFTKNCAICHQIGNEGVKIGPQLDGVGGRGLDRLLEDVLDPNRNVDIAFRQTTLILKDGKSVPGLIIREEGQIVVMADDKGKEIRIAKDDIDERRSSMLSPMPANVAEIISEKDFYDLMAYLLAQRAKQN